MLQFNLLPDVKIEYVRAKRNQRMVIGTAVIATAAALGVALLLTAIVYGVQKKNLSDLNRDIKQYSTELKNTPDIGKILTIQNQLGALTGLHDQKVVASRVFDVAQAVTPPGVTISDFATDFTANSMTISGGASSLDQVNVFTDTLKFANFGADGQTVKPFSDVVLSQFGRNEEGTTYTITLSYDPTIFSVQTPYNLIVPKQNTTNSVTGQPNIFKQTSNGSAGI